MRRQQYGIVLLLTFLLFHISLATAIALRFHQWFQNSAEIFADVSKDTCNATLVAFDDAYQSYKSTAWIDIGIHTGAPVYTLCENHISCIFDNVSEGDKAKLATSGVLLGLLPTLLVVISPSISELALLSAYRPLLAFILSFAAPGVLQTRPFEYEDPASVLDLLEGPHQHIRARLILGPWSRRFCVFAGMAQWLLALAAGVNTVILAVDVTNRSVLSWGCTRTWPILLWVFAPAVIHGLAAYGYRLTIQKRTASDTASSRATTMSDTLLPLELAVRNGQKGPTTSTDEIPFQQSRSRRNISRGLQSWINREASSCASHFQVLQPPPSQNLLLSKVRIGILLSCISGLLSFLHLLYGTITFSGLLFITTLDALGTVAMRLLASSLICRLIVLVELAAMRGVIEEKIDVD